MLFLSDLKEGKPKITNGGQAKKSNGATPVDLFMWQRRKMSPFNGYGGWQWPASRHPPAALTTSPHQDRWRWWGHLSYCVCLPSNTQGKDLLSWKWLNICPLKWGSEWIAYLALLASGILLSLTFFILTHMLDFLCFCPPSPLPHSSVENRTQQAAGLELRSQLGSMHPTALLRSLKKQLLLSNVLMSHLLFTTIHSLLFCFLFFNFCFLTDLRARKYSTVGLNAG